jgi:hypothetical protein
MNKTLYQLIFYAVRITYPGMKTTAKWPLSQAMHETGGFTSNLAVTANNLHGMKMPTKRKTAASGKTASGFASFRSKFDSIRDYIMWLDYNKFYDDATLEGFIKNGYAEDRVYYEKVAKMYTTLAPDFLNPSSVLLGVAAFGLGGVALVTAGSNTPKPSKKAW